MQDMNGKALKVGDKVMMVGKRVRPEYQGHVGEITGPTPENYQRLMLHNGFDPAGCFTIDHDTLAHCTQVVRLDEPRVADWDQIADVTGWRPGCVTSMQDRLDRLLSSKDRIFQIRPGDF